MGDKRNILILIGMLIVFAIIFFLAFAGLHKQEALFNIGIPVIFENWLIMLLSLGSIIRIVWELNNR
jgi:hypothetical protein